MEISGAMVPDKDSEDRLMEVTRLDLSHFMPGQLQKLSEEVEDQPLGAGRKDEAILRIVAPSSAAARTEQRRSGRRRWWRWLGILVGFCENQKSLITRQRRLLFE